MAQHTNNNNNNTNDNVTIPTPPSTQTAILDEEDEYPEDEPAFVDLNSDDLVEVPEVEEDSTNVDAAAAAVASRTNTNDNDEGMDVENDQSPKTTTSSTPKEEQEQQQQKRSIIIRSHSGPVYAIDAHYQPHSRTLLIGSGGGDDRAYLHTLNIDQEDDVVTTIPLSHPHTDSISSISFNLDYIDDDVVSGKKQRGLVAVGSFDGSIVIYGRKGVDDDDGDWEGGEVVEVFDGPTDVEFVSFHPKGGTVILAGSSDGTAWMYHIPTKRCLQVFVGHDDNRPLSQGAFTHDGKWALTAGMDGTVRVWSPKKGVCKHVFRFGEVDGMVDGLTCMDVRMDDVVGVGEEGGWVRVLFVGKGGRKVIANLRHYDEEKGEGKSEDDGMDVDGEEQKAIMDDDEEEEEDKDDPRSVEAVAFAPQTTSATSSWMATGGVDGKVKIWDLTSGQCRTTCRYSSTEEDGEVEVGGVTRIQWHPTLPLIFVSYAHGAICVWDARDGSLCRKILERSSSSSSRNDGDEEESFSMMINDMSIQFIEGGSGSGGRALIVTGVDDGTVRVYDLDIDEMLDQLPQTTTGSTTVV